METKRSHHNIQLQPYGDPNRRPGKFRVIFYSNLVRMQQKTVFSCKILSYHDFLVMTIHHKGCNVLELQRILKTDKIQNCMHQSVPLCTLQFAVDF
jgi:hypothetical protein